MIALVTNELRHAGARLFADANHDRVLHSVATKLRTLRVVADVPFADLCTAAISAGIFRVIANKINQRSARPRFQPAKRGVWPLVRRACPARGFRPVLQTFSLGQQARQPATE